MSDSESDLERASSVKSVPVRFETVPSDQEYKIKIFDCTGTRVDKFGYTLKKGKKLPCKVDIQAKDVCK